MNSKKTETLENVLKSGSLDDFIQYQNNTTTPLTLKELFDSHIAKNNLVLSEIIKKSQMSRDYAYAILNGHKTKPSRDRLIALCLSAEMSREDIDRALKITNYSPLYPQDTRDGSLIYMINNKIYDITLVNEYLYQYGHKTLELEKG